MTGFYLYLTPRIFLIITLPIRLPRLDLYNEIHKGILYQARENDIYLIDSESIYYLFVLMCANFTLNPLLIGYG